MGGYAAYVWSAFAVALLLLVGLFLQSRHAARRRELELELEELRARVRPQRPRAPRPMRPRREVEASPGASESG